MDAAPIFQKHRCRKGRFRWSYEQAEWVCLRPSLLIFTYDPTPRGRLYPVKIVMGL